MFQRPTPIVLNLIILNALVFVFLFLNINNPEILKYFGLVSSNLIFDHDNIFIGPNGAMGSSPYLPPMVSIPAGWIHVKFLPVQLVSSMFSHFTIIHIAFNMLALLSLGTVIERVMGPQRFLALYLFSGLISTLGVAFLDPIGGLTVGASGAISGVAVAFAYYFPDAKLGLMFLPIQFKAKYFVMGFAAISAILYMVGIFNGGNLGGISHSGHLMGMAGGALFLFRNKIFGKRA